MYNDCIISRDTSSSGTSTRHIRHMNRVTGSPSWSWVVILSKTTLYTRSLHFMSYQDLQRAVFSSSSFTRRCFLVSCFLSFVWRVWEWVPVSRDADAVCLSFRYSTTSLRYSTTSLRYCTAGSCKCWISQKCPSRRRDTALLLDCCSTAACY